MRPAPELAGGRTPIQVALARVRLPDRPAGLRARRHRGLRPRRRTRADAADAAARAAERLRHGRLLRAVRGVPARAPEPRRLPALEPVRVLGPAVRRRSAVGRAVPAGARVVRPAGARRAGWSPSSRSTTCSRRSRRTRSRASAAPGRLGAVYAGVAFGAGGYLLARSQALGLLTGAAWLAACVAAAQYAATRQGRGASPLVAGRRRSRSRSWAARSSSRSSPPPPRSSCSCCSCAGAASRSSPAPGRWRSGSPPSRSCRGSSSSASRRPPRA